MMRAATSLSDDERATPSLAGRVARLEVMADIGIGMARRLAREVEAAEVGELAAGDVALAYERIAKAVRLCLILEERLEDGEAARREKAAAARAAQPYSQQIAEARAEKQRQGRIGRGETVVEAVEAMIDREAGDTQREYEAMEREFQEKLEDYGARDFERRPLSAIIAEICDTLGITPDWSLWADETWAVEEAEQQRPGSPYAGRRPAVARPPEAPVALKAGEAVAILERLPP
jgi:hypothetical protein